MSSVLFSVSKSPMVSKTDFRKLAQAPPKMYSAPHHRVGALEVEAEVVLEVLHKPDDRTRVTDPDVPDDAHNLGVAVVLN